MIAIGFVVVIFGDRSNHHDAIILCKIQGSEEIKVSVEEVVEVVVLSGVRYTLLDSLLDIMNVL